MKHRLKNILLMLSAMFALSLFLAGCGISTDDLEKEVLQSIKEEFAKKPEAKEISIHSFTLVKKTETQYKGLLELSSPREGMLKFTVDVTYDGKNMMWKIEE